MWWIKLLKKQYPDKWESILQANNEMPPLSLRVNLSRITRDELALMWTEKGIANQFCGSQGLIINSPIGVHQIPGFAQGLCTVQDGGAQLAAQILMDSLATQTQSSRIKILDACAAPGGKTTHLLEYPNVEVTALDVDPSRCRKVEESCARMGVKSQVICADAGDLGSWWDKELFDAVLLDAPCTASGIVRRHPDIRWLRREVDISSLAEIQARLLRQTWHVLKKGGKLLFCTCSVFKQEGEAGIQSFLRSNTDASICTQLGHLLPTLGRNGGLLTDNEPIDHDGFFYTLLQKN
jgi:16S rRNA (cytosine967-C5)-methyltransferase